MSNSVADSDQDVVPSGYVRRAHGIGGDVVVRGLLQDSEVRLVVGAILTTIEDKPRTFEISAVRPHQGDYILTLVGVSGRNDADAMKSLQFGTPRADLRVLDDKEWWPEDLVGCTVVSTDGETIGSVTDVIVGSSQDRLVVHTEEGLRGEIPFVDALVPEVDASAQTIVVDLPDGLFA